LNRDAAPHRPARWLSLRQLASWVLWLHYGLWLVGCAQAPHRPAGEAGAWAGRIALQVEGQASQSFSALFELQGTAQEGSLVLTSPLGNRLAQLEWNDGHAELISGQDKRTADSLDTLLQDVTGAAIPVAALFSWLQGEPSSAQGWRADLSSLAQGRLTAFRDEPLPQATLRIALTPQ
jgi:outer membrane lipoprotein LolB